MGAPRYEDFETDREYEAAMASYLREEFEDCYYLNGLYEAEMAQFLEEGLDHWVLNLGDFLGEDEEE